MRVGIDHAGQHQPPAEIDRAGFRPDQCTHHLIGADRGNRIAANRHRLRDRAPRIFGVNTAVKEHEVGLGARGQACGRTSRYVRSRIRSRERCAEEEPDATGRRGKSLLHGARVAVSAK